MSKKKDSKTDAGQQEGDILAKVPINLIAVPDRCKRVIAKKPDAAMQELMDSMQEHGQAEPILVRPLEGAFTSYEVVAGRRRLYAATKNKWPEILAVVRRMTDTEAYNLMLAENLHRKDLTPFEEGMQYVEMQGMGKTVKEIAEASSKETRHVLRRMKLITSLCKDWIDLFSQGVPEAEHMTAAMYEQIAFCSHDVQREYLKHCMEYQLDLPKNLAELKQELSEYSLNLKHACFDVDDPNLYPAAAVCAKCPFNSAVQPELFGVSGRHEGEGESICTNKPCFERKTVNHLVNLSKKLNEEEGEQEWSVLTSYNMEIPQGVDGFKHAKPYYGFNGQMKRKRTKDYCYPVLMLTNGNGGWKTGEIGYTKADSFNYGAKGNGGKGDSKTDTAPLNDLPVTEQIKKREESLEKKRLKVYASHLDARLEALLDCETQREFDDCDGHLICAHVVLLAGMFGTYHKNDSGSYDAVNGEGSNESIVQADPSVYAEWRLMQSVLRVIKTRIRRMVDFQPTARLKMEFAFFAKELGLVDSEIWATVTHDVPEPKALQRLKDAPAPDKPGKDKTKGEKSPQKATSKAKKGAKEAASPEKATKPKPKPKAKAKPGRKKAAVTETEN